MYLKKAENISEWTLDRKEHARLEIVKLVFIIYYLLIFEGAIRKWILPGLNKPLYFIKDPFVLLVYWKAFSSKLWPKRIPLFSQGMFLAAAFLCLAFIQIIANQINPFVCLYGWYMYFFYLPLAFIIGECLREEDLLRLMKQTLFFAIPIAFLVAKQHSSPPSALVNRSLTEGIVYTIEYGLVGTTVRTTGTFTFFHGQNQFCGSIVAFLIAAWLLPKEKRNFSILFLWAATIAVIVNLSVVGSRLPFIMTSIILLAAGYCSFLIKKTTVRMRTRFLPVVLVLVGMVLFVRVFPKAYSALKTRYETLEGRKEASVRGRTMEMFYNPFRDIFEASWIGYGLGFASRGAKEITRESYGYGGRYDAGEHEWRRTVAEAGIFFGGLYILYRIMLAFWLLNNAVRATRRSDDPLPLLLVAYIGPILLVWYITHIGSVFGYAWMFAGFCMAANKFGKDKEAELKNENTAYRRLPA